MEEVFDKIKEHANKAKDSAVQVTKTVIEIFRFKYKFFDKSKFIVIR